MKRKTGQVRRREVKDKEYAYSLIEIKAIDEDERIIEGMATTPTPDSYDDIVDPMGAEYDLPIPYLWQHNSREPIGWVTNAKPTEEGIPVKVRIAKTDEPGKLKELLDYAWQQIKLRLVRGQSIGFRPLEYSYMEDTGGIRFVRWKWLELSAVTIPANEDATIDVVRSIDQERRALLSKKKAIPVVRYSAAAGRGSKQEVSKVKIADQIKALQAERAAKAARMTEIQEKAAGENRSKDEAEREEFNTLRDEIKSIDDELKDLGDLEKLQVTKATRITPPEGDDDSVEDEEPEEVGARMRSSGRRIQLKEKLAPGVEFARFAMCLGVAKGNLMHAHEIAKSRFPNSPRVVNVLKAAVSAGTTSDPTWAGPLLEYNQFAGDFVEFLRPQTIIGRFGVGNIPSLRRVPFNINIRAQTSGGSGYWVGQGAPKPLTKFDFANMYLGFAKVANIAVLTEELLRFSNPSAELLTRDSLAAALIERMDTDFVDPAKAEVANVSPASITNGVTPIASTGTDADAIREDARLAMLEFVNANVAPQSLVWLMPTSVALSLSTLRNPLGQKEFPDLTMAGGTFEGLPVITSQYVPNDSTGNTIILVSAEDIWLADDGQVVIDASREASLQMDDAPTNNSTTPTATTLVSMFQTNSVAIKAERFINWKKRRASAVVVIGDVLWGTPGSP